MFAILYDYQKTASRLSTSITIVTLLIATLLLTACGGGSSSKSAVGASNPPSAGGTAPTNGGPTLPFSSYAPHWDDIGVFSSANSCGECHKASTDGSNILRAPVSGDDISPIKQWRHSMMANSFSDPYYQAVMQNEVAEFPHLAGFIEDKCLTCHTPMSRTHAHQTGTSLSSENCNLSDGCYRLDNTFNQMHAREGISCTACHQMQETDNDSGKYIISATDRIIYGPQPNPPANPMLNNTQYQLAVSPHISESQFCGGCHDLSTPSININTGSVSSHQFPEQKPYSEWQNSVYSQAGASAKSCQDCHMPEIENYQTALAVRPNGSANSQWPSRDNYSQHSFVGANTYMLSMLQQQREVLGIADSTTVAGFQKQIELSRAFLADGSAELSVSSINYGNNSFNIDVKIDNKSGHKLPTSYPSRRVWLNVIVRDSGGNVLYQSGTPDSNGRLSTDSLHSSDSCTAVQKAANYQLQDCYTPHQNIITNEQQVAVYEAVMADSNGHSNYVLLYGDHYIKDNRIPPIGYTELASNPLFDDATAIAGAAIQDDDFNKAGNGSQGTGSDIVHYQIPSAAHWPVDPADIEVQITLYYQTIRPAFVAALKRDNNLIKHFTDSYQQQPPLPEVIDSLLISP